MRGDIATKELFSVQDEAKNIKRMLPHVEDVLRRHMSPTAPEVMQKSVKAFGEVATGKLLESLEWREGLAGELGGAGGQMRARQDRPPRSGRPKRCRRPPPPGAFPPLHSSPPPTRHRAPP